MTLAAAAAVLVGTGCMTSPKWDDTATESLHAEVGDMFNDMGAADFDKILEKISDDATAFDLDAKNTPVQIYGKAGVKEMFDGLKKAVEQSQGGFKMDVQIVKHVTHATPIMGYSAVEFDQTITMGDQKMGPFKMRASAVARRIDGKWHYDHWHLSFREMPAMPGGGG